MIKLGADLFCGWKIWNECFPEQGWLLSSHYEVYSLQLECNSVFFVLNTFCNFFVTLWSFQKSYKVCFLLVPCWLFPSLRESFPAGSVSGYDHCCLWISSTDLTFWQVAGTQQEGLIQVTIRNQKVQTELDSCFPETMSVMVKTASGEEGIYRSAQAWGNLESIVMN